MPNEKYSFNFTIDEVKEFLKQTGNRKRDISLQFIYAFIFVMLIILALLYPLVSDFLTGLFSGILFAYTVIMTLTYMQSKKLIKANRTRIATNTYQYEFFDDEILVNIIDSISTRTVHIKYNDITSIKELKNHYVLDYANQNYFLRKSDLIENSKITTL